MSAVILRGDCRETLAELPDACVHSVVTDPPYHLQSIVKRFAKSGRTESTRTTSGPHQRTANGFMGKVWDGGDVSFQPDTWAAFARVLKPGGHLAAFGGTRTFHRIACAIEDAGFEIRDTLMWVYGSGFPKSHNQDGQWGGWGTALKPAWEPIILARKPLVGTVAVNLAGHGTGAINIDGCRVGDWDHAGAVAEIIAWHNGRFGEGSAEVRYADRGATSFAALPGPRGGDAKGRWPANLLHDGSDDVLDAFPSAPGQQGALRGTEAPKTGTAVFGDYGPRPACEPRKDSGSAARFFYCAKASKSDREDGCGNLPLAAGGMLSETSGQHITRRDGGAPGLVRNNHPTVKPTALMRWLVRLITPPGGTILDPFAGSGSTGRAAMLEGFGFIGCEADEGYADIAEARIAACEPVDLVG